jgi:hypothetical protein
LLETEGLKGFEDGTLREQGPSLLVLWEGTCWLKLRQELRGRSVEPRVHTLALLDLHEILEIPSELLGDIVVIGNISDINEVIIEDRGEDVGVVSKRVAPDEQVVVCAMIEVYAVLIPARNHLCFVEILVIDNARFPVHGLHDDLLAVLFEEHVRDEWPVEEVYVVPREEGEAREEGG